MATGYIQTCGALALICPSSGKYIVIQQESGLAITGGKQFATRREAILFMQAAARDGYTIPSGNPISDAPQTVPELASPEVMKARWEARKRDEYLMSGRGFNEEE